MKYYRYLDLDCTAAAAGLAAYVQDNAQAILEDQQYSAWKNVNTQDVLAKVPELVDLFKPLTLTIKYLAFFVTEQPYGTIHIDHDRQSNSRINIPVLNCEKSETRFFTVTEAPVKVLQKNGVPLLQLNPDTCVLVDQFRLTGPVVFRNDQPHQVVNINGIQPRISCTIGFYEDLEYLLA
jgi:hypothetical protein